MDTIRESTSPAAGTTMLQADLFGSSTQPAQIVELQLQDERLVVRGQAFCLQVPAHQVRWPRDLDGGSCLLELPDGTLLHCRTEPRLLEWGAAARASRPPRRRHLLGSGLALFAALVVWAGLPAAAESLLPQVPGQIDHHVGQRLLDRLDAQWLQPSTLPDQAQQDWRQRLTDAVAQVCPAVQVPSMTLLFRHGRSSVSQHGSDHDSTGAIGLPGGTVVLLDEQLGRGTLNALCRELGQLQQRQGMRTLARHRPVSLLMGVAFDDFSATVALAWPVLAQNLPVGVPGSGGQPASPVRMARR